MVASPPNPMDTLPHATVAFVGHHQSGKSTAAGHILVKLGGVDKRTMERVEWETRYRPTSRYAWFLDQLRPERDRGTTLDIKLSHVAVPVPPGAAAAASATAASASGSRPLGRLALTLIDTPGHTDYLKNTIIGITQADVAVLFVDSRPSALESPATLGQTRDLAQLATNLAGQKNMVVAINCLDLVVEADPGAAEQRFKDAVEVIKRLLKRQAQSAVFVPVSGYAGDNLVEPSARLPWWGGPTLTDAIAAAVAAAPAVARGAAAKAAEALPLRIPLIGVFKVGGIGTVPAGRLAGGSLRGGASALLLPPEPSAPASAASAAPSEGGVQGGSRGGLAAAVRSIESFHDARGRAAAGEWVGVAVKGVRVDERRLRRGCVVSDAEDRPARLAEAFTAKVQVLRSPTSLRPGHTAVVHVHTAQAPCRLMAVRRCNNKGEVVEAAATSLREGDIAEVELRPLVALVVEPFRDFPALGRFAVRAAEGGRDDGAAAAATSVIVALGRVEAVKYVEPHAAQPASPGAHGAGRAAARRQSASGASRHGAAGVGVAAATPAATPAAAAAPPATTHVQAHAEAAAAGEGTTVTFIDITSNGGDLHQGYGNGHEHMAA